MKHKPDRESSRQPSWVGGAGLIALLGMAGSGCAAGGSNLVVPAGELGAGGGTPVITAIEDRGGSDIPLSGQVLPLQQDGIAVIGETLLVRGRNFGRQPTITIAGRATAAIARTGDGGILTRVPPGIAAGIQTLTVGTDDGRAERPLTIRRLAVARGDDGLTWLDLGPSALERVGHAELSSARAPGASGPHARHAVVFSPDGRAAYALDRAGVMHVFEMPAPGSPSRRGQLNLPGPMRALFAAPGAQRLVALGEQELVLIDVSSPLRPVLVDGKPLPLPTWARGKRAVRAALSPDGKRLALVLPDRNRLVVVDIAELRPNHEAVRAELAIVPEMLAPVIADVTFAPDGRTLWLVSGMTAESTALGFQRTRVHAVRITEAAAKDEPVALAQSRVVEIAGATRPVAIVTGRALPLASGAAIRLPPERATVHVAAYDVSDGRPAIFSLGADDSAKSVLADRGAGVIGRPEVTPDESWLLAPCGDRSEGWRVLGLSRAGARAQSAPLSIGLDGAAPDASGSAPVATVTSVASVDIRVQP